MSGSNPNARRLAAPKGTMTRGANSGPAIMLLPPMLRACFMPGPPLEPHRPVTKKRRHKWTGVASYLHHFETSDPPPRVIEKTPWSIKEERKRKKREEHELDLKPLVEEYRKRQRECGGEFLGMNCYNTLFVGRLAYEVTDRKLLREFEQFGPVKDLRIVAVAATTTTSTAPNHGKSSKHQQQAQTQQQRSKYAFIEYEHEEDMKRAYRAADGIRLEGREVVVDVERGHTVPTWLPRRLGGGLGGTRLGGKDQNVTRPGRYDPSRPDASAASSSAGGGMIGRGAIGAAATSAGAYPPPPSYPPYSHHHAPPPPPPPPGPGMYGYSTYPPQPPPPRHHGGGYAGGGGGGRDGWDDRGGGGRDWDRDGDRGGGGAGGGRDRDGGHHRGGSSHHHHGHKRPRSNSPESSRRHPHHHGSSSSSSHRHRSSRY